MTVTQLFFIEGIVLGVVLGGGLCWLAWAWDIRDLNKKHKAQSAEAYKQGYKDGGMWKFRERCQIERRCRELEDRIMELDHDN